MTKTENLTDEMIKKNRCTTEKDEPELTVWDRNIRMCAVFVPFPFF